MAVQDLHMHTTWCDGKNTPEEMIISGINKGLNKIGITAHAYTWFDDTYCLKKEDYPAFKKEVRELAVKYKDKIEVLCGIEQDYYSDMSTEGFDYIIGSDHYLKIGEKYYPIDSGEEGFVKLAGLYDGDYLSMCEAYYKNVGDLVNKTGADIIGHFDMITKYNERKAYIDTTEPRYIHAWKKAADELLKYHRTFEINTGAMSRGYRSTPYPSREIFNYLISSGAIIMANSDCHSAVYVAYGLDEWSRRLFLDKGF